MVIFFNYYIFLNGRKRELDFIISTKNSGKMRFMKLSALLLGVTLCEAQISKPRGGDVLQPNQQFEIEWQTAGLQAPINIDLVPSGVTDLSVVAEKIAGKKPFWYLGCVLCSNNPYSASGQCWPS